MVAGILAAAQGVLGALAGALGAKEEPEGGGPTKEETKEKPPAAATPSPALEAIQKVREDLTTFGTTVGIGSTLLLGTAAFATLDALFPLPHDWVWILVVLAYTVAVAAPALATRRFFAAKRRILINTQDFTPEGSADRVPEAKGGLSGPEVKAVERRFAEFSAEEGVPHPAVAEARVERLSRIAVTAEAEGQAEVAAQARAEAARLSKGLDDAIAEAALLVIERRSAEVYRGWRTIALVTAAGVAIAATFILADWSKGERETVTDYLTCLKEVQALKGDDALRDGLCARPFSTPSPTSTPPPTTPTPTPTTIVDALNACAATTAAPGVPGRLWEQAVAACAGLPVVAPTPAATP